MKIVKIIPHALKLNPKNLPNYQIGGLNMLKVGINKGIILSCKVTNILSKNEEVPA